jgi:phospholipid N-methyltransferase
MADPKVTKTNERWDNIAGYEMYVGRWSSLISIHFVNWLNPIPTLKWLELGCGTGALTKVIVEKCLPSHLLAIDQSDSYIKHAKENINTGNVSFLNAALNSCSLTEEFDNITSGLVLNFIPRIDDLLLSLMNNLKSGGQMSSFVWDYGGHYQPMRHFWDAAKEVAEGSERFDAGIKFDICRKEKLIQIFKTLGLTDVAFTNIESIATFRDFDDYWLPIASAQGSVTEFISTLSVSKKNDLKEILRHRLPIALNGEIKLVINALAVKGIKK